MADNRDSIVVMGRSQIWWHDEDDSAFERVLTSRFQPLFSPDFPRNGFRQLVMLHSIASTSYNHRESIPRVG
jgi:hypothetical protein